MRARLVFIVVAVLVVAAITALNWPEFTRAEPLSFGIATATVPLGVTLLVLMGIILAVFLISSAIQESRYLLHHRRHSRDLQSQRDLAEKAEASRFTDLRQHLDTHLRETRTRESVMSTEFEKRLMQSHNELRAQIERMHQMLATRLGEMESRGGGSAVRTDQLPLGDPRDRVKL